MIGEHRFLVSQGLILVATTDPLLVDQVRPDPTGRHREDTDDVSIQSSPSAVSLTDSIYYQSSTGWYRFTGNWDWTGTPDELADALDFFACRMVYDNSTVDWTLVDDYAYCYDAQNDQTGYTHGSSHTSGSLVTRRTETAQSVVWNLEDLDDDIWTFYYQTDHGKGVIWLEPPSPMTTQRFVFDFHHSYRTSEQTSESAVASVSLSGIGFSLSVTYSYVNYQWQRASGGRLVR